MASGDITFTRQGSKVKIEIEDGITRQLNLEDCDLRLNQDASAISIFENGEEIFGGITYLNVPALAEASTQDLYDTLTADDTGIFFLANPAYYVPNTSMLPDGFVGFGERAIYCENGGGGTDDFTWVGLKSQLTGTFTAAYDQTLVGTPGAAYGGTRFSVALGNSGGILTYETFSALHRSGFIFCGGFQEEASPAANNRMWIGFKGDAFTDADTFVAKHVAAFRFSPIAGDTTIKFCRQTGTPVFSVIDTGITADAPTFFSVKFTSSTSMTAQLFDSSGVELWSETYTTNIPASTQTLLFSAVLFNSAAADAHWTFNSVRFADRVS